MLDDATKAKIKENYIKGEGSIQGIANFHRCSVEEVLQIIDQTDLLTVTTPGDMIDAEDAGNATLNPATTHRVKYDPR